MRSLLALAPLAALVLAGSAYAQQPAVVRPCRAPAGLHREYLQSLTRQYYPEALIPSAGADTVIFGFVFDSACNVVRHGVGRRAPGGQRVDWALARLFPDLRKASYIKVGITQAPARTLIVWGVLEKQP